jgi:hypothetical protein
MYDPDGRNGLGSGHWVAYDMPGFGTDCGRAVKIGAAEAR